MRYTAFDRAADMEIFVKSLHKPVRNHGNSYWTIHYIHHVEPKGVPASYRAWSALAYYNSSRWYVGVLRPRE